jgi:hypothetical protein
MAPKAPVKKQPSKTTSSGMITCPFTGKPIEIKTVGPEGHVMGVAQGWSTRIFETKQDCVDFLMTRNGVPPPWANKRIRATESVVPEDTDFMDDLDALKKKQAEAANIS